MKKRMLASILCGMMLLSGCQTTDGTSMAEFATAGDQETTVHPASTLSGEDLRGNPDESAAVGIELKGGSVSCESDAVSIDGTRITLLDGGTYLVTGTLDDGQIVVNANETDRVEIILSGVDITSSDSAAIYSLNADQVLVTLAEGTENTLTNGGAYAAIDENNIDGVIFSKTDLILSGSGSLSIDAPAGHGVVSKDDLTVTGGSYAVTAAEHGFERKDRLEISGGTFQITSGKDGLHAENTEDPTKGELYIKDGAYSISAQGDAISAGGALRVDGGAFDLTTGEGSASVTMTTEDMFAPGGQGGAWADHPGGPSPWNTGEESSAEAEYSETETSASQKGMKSDGTLEIHGGVFTVDSADDCIHSAGGLTIADGEFTLSSGDDALHSDGAVVIQNGTFSIPYCYEGIEGLPICVNGGDFQITAHDDGFNAAGGTDSSGFGGRGEQLVAVYGAFIEINGGDITVTSQGDCIDSNGDLSINGGVLDLTCNGAGNTALDCSGGYTNNGGDVTTNDNSEADPSGMGGGRPMGG